MGHTNIHLTRQALSLQARIPFIRAKVKVAVFSEIPNSTIMPIKNLSKLFFLTISNQCVDLFRKIQVVHANISCEISEDKSGIECQENYTFLIQFATENVLQIPRITSYISNGQINTVLYDYELQQTKSITDMDLPDSRCLGCLTSIYPLLSRKGHQRNFHIYVSGYFSLYKRCLEAQASMNILFAKHDTNHPRQANY